MEYVGKILCNNCLFVFIIIIIIIIITNEEIIVAFSPKTTKDTLQSKKTKPRDTSCLCVKFCGNILIFYGSIAILLISNTGRMNCCCRAPRHGTKTSINRT